MSIWKRSTHALFETGVVPFELLWWGRVEEISETVMLADGKRFYVEAHNIWFTQEEVEAINSGVDWAEVPWLNGLAPNLPPR